MGRLKAVDARDLLAFLAELYAVRDLDGFARHVVSALPAVVRSDIISYNEVNPTRRRLTWLTWPADALDFPDSLSVFERCMPEHPLIAHYARTGDGRALKISDFLTGSQFHRLGLYNEFYRLRWVEHQMVVTLPAPPSLVIGIALNRTRPDFSERDRLTLNLLRPHLIQAYRNAEAVSGLRRREGLARSALAALDVAVVTLTPDGRVLDMPAPARQWLMDYGEGPPSPGHLPKPFGAWVAHQQTLLSASDAVPCPREPLVVRRVGRRLVARLVSGPPARLAAPESFLVLEEQYQGWRPASLAVLRLSQREAEVLGWVAEGKTNEVIGTILGISARTVQKHLERIYRKLGVETRTAAVARAREVSGA